MRIIHITAGTGNFYCGTCLRDHALVKGLQKLGHDAMMVPLYLPLVTESAGTGEAPLFFGGINVYLQQKSAFFRHTPRWFDRIFDTKIFLTLASQKSGLTKPRDLGELTLSTLKAENGFQIKELKRLIDWLKTMDKPDVVCLSNALLLGFADPIRRELGIPVVCSLQGEDSFLDNLPKSYSKKCGMILQEQAESISTFIAVSKYYAECMKSRLAIPERKMHVIYNGIDLEGFDVLKPDIQDPVIGYLAQMIPGKGLETLIDAFIELKKRNRIRNLRLHVAGSQTAADVNFGRRLQNKIDSAGYTKHVRFSPNINRGEKLKFFSELSVFSVPAIYGESFGLYVIEALAAGVPVVQPRHAAFPELLELTKGGLLYEPDNLESLVENLEALILNKSQRECLGNQGKNRVFKQFSQECMARNISKVLRDTVQSNCILD